MGKGAARMNKLRIYNTPVLDTTALIYPSHLFKKRKQFPVIFVLALVGLLVFMLKSLLGRN
jgi:hypothetical protein